MLFVSLLLAKLCVYTQNQGSLVFDELTGERFYTSLASIIRNTRKKGYCWIAP